MVAKLAVCAALTLALTGCNRSTSTADDSGRYAGVGIYEADKVWKHVQGAPATGKAQAKPKDDSTVIVVVDRQTGELRQCGNLSGFCIAMNPWQGAAPRSPVKLDAHADEIDDDHAGATNDAVNAVQ